MYREPEGPNIRVDTGVAEGSEISVYYDPMVAKLITTGQTRETALDTMGLALDRCGGGGGGGRERRGGDMGGGRKEKGCGGGTQ